MNVNPVLLRLVASLKVAAYIGVGCGGTLGVQHYMTSSSPQEGGEAAAGKENGKEMKFEVNQLSKQLEEKEQSLKTLEELLAKKETELKEERAAVSSVSAQTTTVTTVAEPKPEQPIIDDVPFGEEDPKNGKSRQSKGVRRNSVTQADEAPTPDVPKRPAVFDGGGTPAVAFPPTTDVVAIKEGGDIPEAFQAELQAKDRMLGVLREQRQTLKTEKDALEAELIGLNTLNEDLKRELAETKQKLAEADADAKEKARRLEPESNVGLACLRGNEWEDPEKRSEYLKDWLSQKGMLPKEGSFAVCRLKPKEASKLWYFGFPMIKWMLDACMDNRRGALNADAVRRGKVNLSDVNKYYAFEPISMYVCATRDPGGGMIVKKGKERYSVRPRSMGWLYRLFCPCKRKANEIRKLKYEEAVVEVESKESLQHPKIPELSDILSTEEQGQFEKLLPTINDGSFVSLDNEAREPNEDDGDDPYRGVYASYEELGEPEVGNKYRTIFFVFEPCFLIWDGFKKAKSAFFGK